jgi:hypothetical protein
MRTATVTHEGITAVVRSLYRRTSIIEAQYKQALREVYPDVLDFERALFRVEMPSNPNNEAQIAAYVGRVAPFEAEYPLGAQYSRRINEIAPIMARISLIVGAAFALGPDGRFDNASAAKAFEHALDEEDEGGLWVKLAEAINEIDAPVTPVDERPAETLTEAEKSDPLSVAPAPVASGG